MNQKITIVKENGKRLDLIVTEKTIERLIDAICPDKGANGLSKSYILLLDFLYKE